MSLLGYHKIRDPWWRFKHYVRMWLLTMLMATGLGWLTGGWDGIVTTTLTATGLQVVLFSLWEFGERRRDREFNAAREFLALSMDEAERIQAAEDERRGRREPPTG